MQYKFTVAGQEYGGEEDQVLVDDLPGDPTSSYDGQNATVTVYYDPNHPAKNRLEQADTFVDKMISGAGLLCVPVCLFGVWRVFRYDRYARSIGT